MSTPIISQPGRFYEDFIIGDIYQCAYGRTVTESDNNLFTSLTLNNNPLHFDAEYCKNTRWGKVLVNSTFTLALITGMSVHDVSQNAVANLGWEAVKLPNPVFISDTIYCSTEVLNKRKSKSNPEAGIVTVKSLGTNQKKEVVIEFTRSVMVYKREFSPINR